MEIKKQNVVILIVLTVIAAFFFSAVSALAQNYVPLSPLPGTGEVSTSEPAEYFRNMFRVLVGVAGVLAVIIIMFYGIQYMLSTSEGKKSTARMGISSVVFGIFIILLSYIVLSVINPDLIKLRFFDKLKEIGKGLVEGEKEPVSEEKGPTQGEDAKQVQTVVNCEGEVSNNRCDIFIDQKSACEEAGCTIGASQIPFISCDCGGSDDGSGSGGDGSSGSGDGGGGGGGF